MPVRINKATIKAIVPTGKDHVLWDDSLPGFGLRVWPSGKTVFIVTYRTDAGTQRKATLGSTAVLSPEQARNMAMQILAGASRGEDPQRDKMARRNAETIQDLHDAFFEVNRYPSIAKSTEALYRRLWAGHILPRLGRTPIREVVKADIERLHASMADRPPLANQVIRRIRAAYFLAIDRGWATSNPATRIRQFKERKKQTILTPEQMRGLVAALEAQDPRRWASVGLFKALMITGLRMREWSLAEWSWVNWEAGTLALPRTKTVPRVVQLGDDIRIMLRQIESHPLAHKRWIFPAEDRKGPLTYPYPTWRAVMKQMGLSGVRPHDLRHTYATYGLLGGSTLTEVQMMLGHSSVKTTERYLGVFDEVIRSAQTRTSVAIMDAIATGTLPVRPEVRLRSLSATPVQREAS